MKKHLIAITMGDPGGVGPEIILKAVRRLKGKARYLLIGKKEVFNKANLLLPDPISFSVLDKIGNVDNLKNEITLLDLQTVSGAFYPRRESKINGRLAYLSLRSGVQIALSGLVSALVTAPISKKAIRSYAKGFCDQTEFLRTYTKAKCYAMSFIQGRSCVTLITTHVPVAKIGSVLRRRDIVDKTILTVNFLKQSLKIRQPKIAVLGLNPHAGEKGMLGKEELKIIGPAVRDLRKLGICAAGPLAADSAFYFWRKGKYDALIAMYHDQGLGPFKMLHFHNGIHMTLGLPFIRISPDHGTAFDVAYRGKASSLAMEEAIRAAIRFAGSR